VSEESYAKELAAYKWVRRRWKPFRLRVAVANDRTGTIEYHVLVVGGENSPRVRQQVNMFLGRGKRLAREPVFFKACVDHDHCPFCCETLIDRGGPANRSGYWCEERDEWVCVECYDALVLPVRTD
jgi:hypothetical protein